MTTKAMTTKAMTTNVREAALRPFGKPSRLWWLAIVVLSVTVGGGVAAWATQLRDGMGASGYSDQAFWQKARPSSPCW